VPVRGRQHFPVRAVDNVRDNPGVTVATVDLLAAVNIPDLELGIAAGCRECLGIGVEGNALDGALMPPNSLPFSSSLEVLKLG
jgi:hypothetical protein